MITDAELTALALASDPETAVAPDAVCLWDRDGSSGDELLPAWYMPAPMRTSSSRGHRIVVGVVVTAFLLINAAGLCSTYGHVAFG